MGGTPAPMPPTLQGSVEHYYLQHPPYPTATEEPGWVCALPKAQVVLRWIGSGCRVVDLGCHKGALGAAIRDAGNEVVGVDAPELARLARETYGLPTVPHDLNEPLPFPDEAFDVVLAASVLDYIPQDLAFLGECRRIAAPGGRLVTVVPNAVSLLNRLKTLTGRVGRDFGRPDGYHNLNRYTLEGIKTLVAVAGFQVTATAKCPLRDPHDPWLYWAERMLPATFASDLAVLAVKVAETIGGVA